MEVGKPHKFILFTLGEYYSEVNKRLKTKSLQLIISKVVFIDLLKKAGIVKKKERAVYKNLEWLEKKKYIKYDNRVLSLTNKGNKELEKIRKEIQPYINVSKILKSKDLLKIAKKSQTVLKS